MKRLIRIVFGIALLQLLTATATWAVVIPFSDTKDWNTSSVSAGGVTTTYTQFSDTSLPNWSHNISFSPPASSILTASLEIRHQGNGQQPPGGACNNNQEVWFVQGPSAVLIGNLTCSVPNWTVDIFAIPVSLYPALPAAGWTLVLSLGESTSSPTNEPDVIRLDYATLYGTYESVPEPGSLVLLGLGLAGLGLSRRRKAD